MNMTMTDSAIKRVLVLKEKENNPNLMLRVTILGGGCSGFQYELGFDDTVNPGDVTFDQNGAVLVTDETSLPFLNGAEIDFESSMMKSSFKIRNPQAASSCGCGNSFMVRN